MRDISIGLLDFLKSEYVEFNEDSDPSEVNLIDTLYASFSWPGLYPPAEVMGSAFIDGSAIYDLDIYAAVNKCL